MNSKLRFAIGALLLSLLLLAGCGGDTRCGPGTVLNEGRCLPEIGECGPGTVRQGDECVPACDSGQYWDGSACAAVPECAAGTVFEPASGSCVPQCDTDQRWDGSACVPLCAPGTQLDPVSGQCVLVPEVCGAGTHWEDGQCVADLTCGPGTHAEGTSCVPDTLPEPDVVEGPEPDGEASFTLPAVGAGLWLGGVVDEPVDSNGDGYPDGDWDAFRFSASAGSWLRLLATSDTAALPGFMVQSLETDGAGYPLYTRYCVNPVGPDAVRELYLPRTGEYRVLVTDLHNMMIDVFGAGVLPVGGDAFTYRVWVENLGVPVPTAVADLPLAESGTHDEGRLHFFLLSDLAARDVLGLRSAGQARVDGPDDVYTALLLFDPTGGLWLEMLGLGWDGDAAAQLVVPQAGDYLLVQDFLVSAGAALDFDLSAWLETVTDCSAAACTPAGLAAGEHRVWSFDLAAGDFFLFAATVPSGASENLRVRLLDQDFEIISDASAGPTWNRWDRLVAGVDTRVYLWLEGWFGGAVPDWTLDVVHEPLGAAPADGLLVFDLPPDTLGDCGLARFEAVAGEVALVTRFEVHDSTGLWTQPAQQLSDSALGYLGPALNTADAALAPIEPALAWLPADGTYLHRALDADPLAAIAGATYDLELVRLVPTVLGTPVAGTPVGATAQLLDTAGGAAFYSFAAESGAGYQVDIVPQTGASLQPVVRLFAFGFHYQTSWYSRADRLELGQLDAATAAAAGQSVALPIVAPYAGRLVVGVFDASGGAPQDGFDITVNRP